MRTLSILWLMVVTLFLGQAAAAGELLELTIINRDTGVALDSYPHRGQRYVAGQPKQRYAILLVNRTNERVLAILSVDGVNAVSGETASPIQTGYVLEPYEQAEIAGWRKSDKEVAQFYFTSLPDSYAARTNRPDNVGVIGVAVFREKVRPVPPPVVNYGDAPAPRRGVDMNRDLGDSRMTESNAGRMAAEAPAAAPAKRAERIGTGHGEREYAPITHTEFVRASKAPTEVVALRYDSREHLIDMGVIPRPTREPQPFPNRYVPDPPR